MFVKIMYIEWAKTRGYNFYIKLGSFMQSTTIKRNISKTYNVTKQMHLHQPDWKS